MRAIPARFSASVGGRDDGQRVVVRRFDSHVVRNALLGLWLGWVSFAPPLAAQEWEVHEETEVAEPGGAGTFWGRVTGAAIVGQRIFALDAAEGRLYAFDMHGGRVWTAARRGQGPGEISQYVGAVLSMDSLLAVPDPGNRRISYFALDGKAQNSEPLETPAGSLVAWGVVNGRLVYLLSPLPHAAIARLEDSATDSRIVVRDAVTGIGTVVLSRDVEQAMTITADGRLVVNTQPERLLMAADGHALYVASTRRFHIDVLDERGTTLHVIQRDVPARRIPRAVVDQRRRQAEAMRSGMPPELIERYRFTVEVPEVEPVLLALLAGDGLVFVRMPSESDAPVTDRRWEIFARDGEPKGHVLLPAWFMPRAVSAGVLVGLRRDADDVETLAILRLVPPPT
jgi:hypothetical protein